MDKTGLLDCSFLEVTINSNKLMQILEKLMKQTNENSSEIKILREVIPTIKQSVATSLETTEARVKLETQRSAMKLREDMNFLKLHLESNDGQFSKFVIQTEKKFKQKQTQLERLQQQRKRTQSLINIYQQSRLSSHNKIYETLDSIKESLAAVEKEINQTESKTDDKFEMMFIKMQSMIKKNNMSSRRDGSFDLKGGKERKNSIAPKGGKSTISSTNMTNWAIFSSKISQFEKRNEQKDINSPFLNKVLYSKKIEAQQGSQNILDSSEATEIQGFSRYQLENFNQMFSMCNKENQKNIDILKNKMVIQEEKLGVHFRKMEKMLQTHSEFRLNFKKLEEKRTDEHHIELIKTQIKKVHLQLGEELDKKLNRDIFEREKNKIMEKICIVQENLTQKADKGDMKKAFLFMEEKIKQLIILIASDQNEEKDGAIKKIPAKCLSCDKGLQLQNCHPNSMPTSALTSRQNEPNLRTITRKIRTRMHTSNQNSSVNL